MEENPSLFGMSIDPITREHLSETAKWARFLAIVGLIFLIFLVVLGIYSAVTLSQFEDEFRGYSRRSFATGVGIGTAITYFIVFLIYVFPIVFTLRFASKMRLALNTNDQEALNTSFQNLKICFRYIGVVTIIFLVLMVLGFVLGIAGTAMR